MRDSISMENDILKCYVKDINSSDRNFSLTSMLKLITRNNVKQNYSGYSLERKFYARCIKIMREIIVLDPGKDIFAEESLVAPCPPFQ